MFAQCLSWKCWTKIAVCLSISANEIGSFELLQSPPKKNWYLKIILCKRDRVMARLFSIFWVITLYEFHLDDFLNCLIESE